jgi:type I restriction enzyme S subunit
MRKDWKIVPFGEVCEISGGSQPPKSNFIYEPKEGYIRLVQVRDYRTNKYMTYVPISKAKKFCTKSDIMIGRYGPPIFGIFSGIEGAYNVALMKAIPNEEKLDKEYFRWFLKTDELVRFVEKTSKRAAGQDGVRKERLYAYPIPIPPLSEQKQIVTILDEAFAAIDQAKANIEKNIENAKELFQSKLNDIFSQKGDGWEEKTLEEVCEKTKNIKWQNHPKSEFEYVDLSSVSRETLNVTETTTVNKKNAPSRAKKIINAGDVIFATTRPTLRRATIIDEE